MGFFSPSEDRNRQRQGGFFSRVNDFAEGVADTTTDFASDLPGVGAVTDFFDRDGQEQSQTRSTQRDDNMLRRGIERLPGGDTAYQLSQGAAEAATGQEPGTVGDAPQGNIEQIARGAGRPVGFFTAGATRSLGDMGIQTLQDVGESFSGTEGSQSYISGSRRFGDGALLSSQDLDRSQEALHNVLPEPEEDASTGERFAQGAGEFASLFAPGMGTRGAINRAPGMARSFARRRANQGAKGSSKSLRERLAPIIREVGGGAGFSGGIVQQKRANDEDVDPVREFALGGALDLATLGAGRALRPLFRRGARSAEEAARRQGMQNAYTESLDEASAAIRSPSSPRNVLTEPDPVFTDSRPGDIDLPSGAVSPDQASQRLQNAGYSQSESDNIISLTGRADDSGNIRSDNLVDNARRYSDATSQLRTQRSQQIQPSASGRPVGANNDVLQGTARQLQDVGDPEQALSVIRRSFPDMDEEIARELSDFSTAVNDIDSLTKGLRIGKEEADAKAGLEVTTPQQAVEGPPSPGGVRAESMPGDFGEPGFIGVGDVPNRDRLSPTARSLVDRDVREANEPLDQLVRERASEVRAGSQAVAEGGQTVRRDFQDIGGRIRTNDPDLPNIFKAKNGRHPDDVVKELNEEKGYMFEDGEDLIQSLKDNPTMTPKTHREARLEAIRDLMRGKSDQAQEFQAVLNELENNINELMRAEGIPEFSVDDFAVRRLIQEQRVSRSTASGPKAGKTLELEDVTTDQPIIGDEVSSTDSPFGERTFNVKTTANTVMPQPQIDYLGGSRFKPGYIAVNVDGQTKHKAIKDSTTGFYGSADIARDIVEGKIRNKGKIRHSPIEESLAQDGQEIGSISRDIMYPAQKASASRHEANAKLQTYVRGLAKQHNIVPENKEAGKRIANLAEAVTGQELITESTESLVARLGYTADEIDFMKGFRQVTDMLHETINNVRIAMGEDPIGYVENFYPHMVETSRWQRFIRGGRGKGGIVDNATQEPPDSLSFMVPDAKFNPSMQARLGNTTEYDKDFFKVMKDYIASAADEIHIRPAIANTKVQVRTMREVGDAVGRSVGESANYWERYMLEGLLGKQSALDKILKIQRGGRLEATLSKIQEIRVRGALQGNISWNMVTQPTSMFLTVKDAGYKKTARGAQKWLMDSNYRNDIMKKAPSLVIKTKGGKSTRMSLQGINSDLDNKIQRTKLDKWDDFINFLGDTEERHLTGASWAAGYEDALQRGYKGEDAEIYAEFVAQTTQGMYSRESRPLILNSQLVRTLVPFQTFTMYAFNHASRMLGKDAGLTVRGARKYKNRVAQGLTMLSAIALANQYSEAVTGRKVTTPGSFVPFAGQGIDTAISEAGGEYQPTQRSEIAILDDTRRFARAWNSMVSDGDMGEMRELATTWGLGGAGIGGAGQINKMIDGYSDYMDGESVTSSGRQRFEIERDTSNFIQAMVGGPYATEGGQEYVNENFSGASIFDVFSSESHIDQAEQTINSPIDQIERQGGIGETPRPNPDHPMLRNNNQ